MDVSATVTPPPAQHVVMRRGVSSPADALAFLKANRRWDFLGAVDALVGHQAVKAMEGLFCMSVPSTDQDLHADQDVLLAMPRSFAESNVILPLSRTTNGSIQMAIADPSAVEVLADAERMLGSAIVPQLVEEERLHSAIADAYDRLESDNEQAAGDPGTENLQDLRDLANQAPVIRLVHRILREALTARASDIHLEPGPEALFVRYRVDGELIVKARHPRRLAAALVSRIKILAELDISERRMPLDGRIRMRQDGHDYDLRVATTPTVHGESVVLRILDRSSVRVALEKLDFSTDVLRSLRELIRRPNGIVLVTGPTGAGKTTSLYAALNDIITPELKIITVEDPVEYQIPGITQIAVDHKIGLNFARILRSVLRQDPDVVMVGEIRDAETARIAIQAALTGHLVLATLHTNDAPSAITRLADMGIEPFLISATVVGVLAQRLCRRLHSCQVSDQSGNGPVPVGCPTCETGWQGRIAIHELLVVDEVQRKLIAQGAPEGELRSAWRASGGVELRGDGLAKVLQGLTTRGEVIAATTDN